MDENRENTREMRYSKIVYEDRLLKITKRVSRKKHKYKIEMTNGLIGKSWEEYFNNDEQAIERAKLELKAWYLRKEGVLRW